MSSRDRELKIGKVLLTLARKPWILPWAPGLAQNARNAGENLAAAVTAAMGILQLQQI